MQFLAPTALLALPPLAAVIILLYLLKLRRREVTVPSVFLWRRAVQDVQANAPFQKLKRNLLLLLQLAALALLIMGLSAPFVLARRLAGKSTVVILDASASMNATDVAGSRLEAAKLRARQIVKGMGRKDEVALVVCAARAWVASPFTRDRRLLIAAVDSVEPTDTTTNMRDALLLALGMAGKRPETRVYLVSDGAFSALPAVTTSAEIRFLSVGRRRDNVAILAFEAARAPAEGKHQLFLRLKSYAPEAKRCVIGIYQEDNLLDADEVTLEPGKSKVRTYSAAFTKEGVLRAELEVDDDLGADNVAYAFAEPAAPISVLLVGPGNLFLEQGLLVLPQVALYKTPSLSAKEVAAAYAKHDVVVFDRVPPPAAASDCGVLLIACTGAGYPFSLGPELSAPAITRWEEQHPALRYVNLGAAQLASARVLQTGTGAVPLAYAGEHPVVAAAEKDGARVLAFGWDLLNSDLPLRVGFPVLLHNSVRWLSETRSGSKPVIARPGEVLRFAAQPTVTSANVELPDGRRLRVAASEGSLTVSDVSRVGVYRMTAGDREWRWALDLRSAEESDLQPAKEIKIGERRVPAGRRSPRIETHLWPYLAMIALALLLFEWHLYHRRY